jgi:hypothetical protein
MIRANKQVEDRAAKRLSEYETRFGSISSPPVPLELIIERLFDLNICWESIPDRPGAEILGALRPSERMIVLNELHVNTLQSKPGLERFTLAHELGHWDLYVDQAALFHPTIPGFEISSPAFNRTATNGEVLLLSDLTEDPDFYAAYKEAMMGVDTPAVKTAVNRYAAAILMPQHLMSIALRPIRVGWHTWRQKRHNLQMADMYRLAEQFGVTISAFTVRLDQLGLLYVADDGTIHQDRAEYHGQTTLPI